MMGNLKKREVQVTNLKMAEPLTLRTVQTTEQGPLVMVGETVTVQ